MDYKLTDKYIPIEKFINNSESQISMEKKLYVETYGCQMNFADTEIVNGIMNKAGYDLSENPNDAAIILLNTCSIRENAESKVIQRLTEIKKFKKANPKLVVGVIGCMAERLKRNLLHKKSIVDLVIGPDEYRKLPDLIDNILDTGEKGIAVKLSRVETYDDIAPIRKEGICAWLSVMRGCDKFCSFCVVPYTRGRERSRTLQSIVAEITQLEKQGFKDVTLLGQNVNSYRSGNFDFADLLEHCALAVPSVRIRFTTSHPQDISIKLINVIAKHNNICKYIHLPIQSGSNRILDLMKRNYTVEHYLNIIKIIRDIIPDVCLSTDIITGFCTETEDDHKMTLDIMKEVKYDGAYMFKYSPRENTKAWQYDDDVDEEIKTRRIMEIVELQRQISEEININQIGKVFEVIIEGISKKSKEMLFGRTDGNKTVIIPDTGIKAGESVLVKITKANSATLFGELI
jgi:tRNA-2-methylthio-N6-dimethylallyladenosine synthase